ncbi:10568_t:CDS:1, partial [Paraglomus occultum]
WLNWIPSGHSESMDMLRNINAAKDIDEAEVEALGWIRSIVLTFHEKKKYFAKSNRKRNINKRC